MEEVGVLLVVVDMGMILKLEGGSAGEDDVDVVDASVVASVVVAGFTVTTVER